MGQIPQSNMCTFDFLTPGRVTFGAGKLQELPALMTGWGKRVLVVGGRNRTRAADVLQLLEDAGLQNWYCAIDGEPTLEMTRQGVAAARHEAVDAVVGLGGGSAMDAAKAIAVLTTNSGEPLDYLEVVGKGQTLEHAPLPCLTIPTTAGTGAEVTRNAVLGSPEHGVKASLRGPRVLARAALVDPELTRNLPADVTAHSGFDALTQLLEALVSRRANAMTEMFCREGLGRVKGSLKKVYAAAQGAAEGEMAAREDMAWASLLSGLALGNAGLGAVHGFASPLGAMTGAAHGAICASLLRSVVRVNVRALAQRQPEGRALRAFAEAAQILTGKPDWQPLDEWLGMMQEELAIQPLGKLGLRREQIPVLVERAAKASSMKGNPLDLEEDELVEMVEGSF